MSEKRDEFLLQVFNGDGYDKWRFRLMLYLEMKDCHEVILNDQRPDAVTADAWRKKELKAKNYIVNSMSNTQLELIISEETANQMVKKLDELYLVKTSAMKLLCKRKLLDFKMVATQNPTEFFNDFEKLLNELKNAGENVTEDDKLNYLLLAIPESLSHIVDIVDALPKEGNPVEYVKSKLLEFQKRESTEKNAGMNRQSQVFISDKERSSRIRQSNGPKSSRIQQTKDQSAGCGDERNGDRKPVRRCYKCNRPRHIQKYCWNSNYNSRRGPGNRHMAGQSSVDSDETNYTFNVEVMSSATETNRNEEETFKWILDSGCSDHIVNSDKYFTDFVTLKDPVKIKVGDGFSLNAKKKGNIPVCFVVNGEFIRILIKNVFYVPSMRHNLLSVSCITDQNDQIIYNKNYAMIKSCKGRIIAQATRQRNLYELSSYIQGVEVKQANIYVT